MPKTWSRRVDPESKAVQVPVTLHGPAGESRETLFVLDIGTPVTIADVNLATYLGESFPKNLPQIPPAA